MCQSNFIVFLQRFLFLVLCTLANSLESDLGNTNGTFWVDVWKFHTLSPTGLDLGYSILYLQYPILSSLLLCTLDQQSLYRISALSRFRDSKMMSKTHFDGCRVDPLNPGAVDLVGFDLFISNHW